LTNRRNSIYSKEYRDEMKKIIARCITDGENPDKIKSASVIQKLRANWTFYQKWTDGLLYRWFDDEGCFKIKTIERSYFTNFFELRKTPQGRKVLLNWARAENWRKSKKFSISKTEIEESSRLRGDST